MFLWQKGLYSPYRLAALLLVGMYAFAAGHALLPEHAGEEVHGPENCDACHFVHTPVITAPAASIGAPLAVSVRPASVPAEDAQPAYCGNPPSLRGPPSLR